MRPQGPCISEVYITSSRYCLSLLTYPPWQQLSAEVSLTFSGSHKFLRYLLPLVYILLIVTYPPLEPFGGRASLYGDLGGGGTSWLRPQGHGRRGFVWWEAVNQIKRSSELFDTNIHLHQTLSWDSFFYSSDRNKFWISVQDVNIRYKYQTSVMNNSTRYLIIQHSRYLYIGSWYKYLP